VNIETLLFAALGTASYQHGWEECTAYDRSGTTPKTD